MRLKAVRWLVGAGLATAVTSLLTVFAPVPAHADDCYRVWAGPQSATVCPWD